MKLVQPIKSSKFDQDDSLIPLINIVFLMLIFFMIAGHIEVSDVIKVKPPTSISEIKRADGSLEIIVSADQQISVEGELLSIDELTDRVSQHFSLFEIPDQFTLIIKVDGGMEVDDLQPVLSAIKESGVKKVSLATQWVANND